MWHALMDVSDRDLTSTRKTSKHILTNITFAAHGSLAGGDELFGCLQSSDKAPRCTPPYGAVGRSCCRAAPDFFVAFFFSANLVVEPLQQIFFHSSCVDALCPGADVTIGSTRPPTEVSSVARPACKPDRPCGRLHERGGPQSSRRLGTRGRHVFSDCRAIYLVFFCTSQRLQRNGHSCGRPPTFSERWA